MAPTRSAKSPQPIFPVNDARPATLSTVAAAIAGTPRSIACVTMWKIGPECAAQHAKCVSAMAANCGVRTTCPIVRSGPAAAVAASPASAAGGLRTRKAAGRITSHTRSPMAHIAVRQSKLVIIHRASGAITVEPTLRPAETRATARLRFRVNHFVVVAISGA